MDAVKACLVSMCLCLVLPVSWSQSPHQEQEFINTQPQPAPGGEPHPTPAAAHIQDVLKSKEETEITPKQMYANVGHAKLGLFIAAALGTMLLMGMVYCVYLQFYTKHQYLHTQLHDHSELTLDLTEDDGSVGARGRKCEVRRSSNGSFISNTPSVISVPPRLSPPPSAVPYPPHAVPYPPPAVPYPPLFLSSNPLRTISVRDLERSFV